MKVELEKITLGYSPLTDSVFAGISTKNGTRWIAKNNVTNSFIGCVISRWEGHKEVIQSGKDKWEITVKKIKPKGGSNV